MPEVLEPPTAPPAPAPEPSTDTPPASEQQPERSLMDDAFGDLENFAQEKATPKAKAKVEAPKLKDESKPDEPPKPVAEKPEKPVPIPELRKNYDKLKAEHAALKAEFEKASKSKIDDSSEKAWQEKVSAYEKRIEAERQRVKELDDIVKQSAYEQSEEYKKTYIQPIVTAVKTGQQAVIGMTYTDAQGENRPAVAEDFNEVLSATDFSRARAIAKARFPDDVGEVMSLWKDVKGRVETKDEALSKWKEEAGQREQVKMEQDKALSEKRNTVWTTANKAAQEKYPDLFKPIEGDEAGNQALEKGFQRAAAVFNGGKMPDEKGNEITLSDDDMVLLHSEAYLKIAGFNRLANAKRALQKEVETLKAELAQYKSSTPKSGGSTEQVDDGEPSWEDALAKLGKPMV